MSEEKYDFTEKLLLTAIFVLSVAVIVFISVPVIVHEFKIIGDFWFGA